MQGGGVRARFAHRALAAAAVGEDGGGEAKLGGMWRLARVKGWERVPKWAYRA